MASHLTRKELKQDNVALKVEETFSFLGAHRSQVVRIGGAILALILIVAAVFYYRSSQSEVRQQLLGEAIAAQNAPVSATPAPSGVSYSSEASKRAAVVKAYTRLTSEHSGSTEGYIAEYTLGTMDAESGNDTEARRKYQDVIDHADANYGSLAKLSLAQLNFATNRAGEAQAQLKDLMDHPTDLVSKNQAAFTLARGIAKAQPAEARKLLVPMAASGSEISQTAAQALADLPVQQ